MRVLINNLVQKTYATYEVYSIIPCSGLIYIFCCTSLDKIHQKTKFADLLTYFADFTLISKCNKK